MAEITEKRFPRIVFTDSQDNSEISGGGGSSDLSTCIMTLSAEDEVDMPVYVAWIDADNDYVGGELDLYEDGETHELILYKGKGDMKLVDLHDYFDIAVEGDAELAPNFSYLTYTGDFTLIITTKSGES